MGTPSGFRFDGDSVWLADLEGGNLFQVGMGGEPGRLIIPDWIQDALPLDNDLRLVADVNNRRLLVHDSHGRYLHEVPFDPN